MNLNSSSEPIQETSRRLDWISGLAWLFTLVLVAGVGYLGWDKFGSKDYQDIPAPTNKIANPTITPQLQAVDEIESLPIIDEIGHDQSIHKFASMITDIPIRQRQEVIEYSVSLGDSVFGIAQGYTIQPETVLWSNYSLLKDNPHALTAGMVLRIPPTDGVYYQWQEGDTLETVAAEFETPVEEIITWPGNHFDLTNPSIEPDSWVMIPGGVREFQQWIIPVMPRGAAGVSAGVYGSGVCSGGYDGLYGSGAFIWPTINRYISGNDYWSGHLAIDIGSSIGESISASDSGVVVFAGWATGGYGYTAAIDHGNGYQTLYAHLSGLNVSCGQSVTQGQTIGFGGSTGNSTGPHLHFEIRYQGGFVNPWYVLPAP